jgi:hypothetical protein
VPRHEGAALAHVKALHAKRRARFESRRDAGREVIRSTTSGSANAAGLSGKQTDVRSTAQVPYFPSQYINRRPRLNRQSQRFERTHQRGRAITCAVLSEGKIMQEQPYEENHNSGAFTH